LATIPQSWSGEIHEKAGDLTRRQEQQKKRGMIKRIVPEMWDHDLTISTKESERETAHEGWWASRTHHAGSPLG
jgi:hypothetical protein